MKLSFEPTLFKKEIARQSFLEFVKYTKPDYEVNWHHKAMCEILQDFAEKKIKRLIIQAPPRSGKSELVSRRLPAYILGKNPDASIITAAYGAELASMMNRDVQRIIDSPAYYELFPETTLNRSNVRTVSQGSALRNSDIFEIVGRKGVYKCAGVGGALTGMGGSFALVDDPIKSKEDADSKVMREKVWDWYTSVLYTRLEKNGSVLLTMTRWHEADLAGHLIKLSEKEPDADKWTVITFPAILDEKTDNPYETRQLGEGLWENKFSLKTLHTMKASMGSRVWQALYQQRPTAPEGTIIKRDWLRFYRELPRMDKIILSWDMAFKESDSSDYVVGQVWGVKGSEYYLIDQVRDRMDFPKTIMAFKLLTKAYSEAAAKLVEAKANGQAVIDVLKKEISGIIPIDPKDSKESRLSSIAPLFEAGNIYYPENKSFTHDNIEELISFPKAPHDDTVDATSQAVAYLSKNKGSSFRIGVIQR